MSQGKQKSHKLLPGVNSPGIFLPGIEPEQLFVFTYPERPESPGPVRFYRVYLFKILVDLVVDSCYIGVSKKENAMKHWELEHNENYMRIEWNEAATFNFQMPIGGQWVDYHCFTCYGIDSDQEALEHAHEVLNEMEPVQ